MSVLFARERFIYRSLATGMLGSYFSAYWMSRPYFNSLGEEQLRLAVASASRWKEIESFLNSKDYANIRSQSWKGTNNALDIVLRRLRAEYRGTSPSFSLSEIRRASALKRDFDAPQLIREDPGGSKKR